jgi:serine/threonine-protein kinase HipA
VTSHEALIVLHRGLERQGPGDAAFARAILAGLPSLPNAPAAPRIADLGCGSGAGALLLAEHFGVPVTAVDLSRDFLGDLERCAAERGLSHLVRTVEADIGALGWPDGSLDLLWSEGAAYNLTFAGALRAWRPLLAPGGVAVISELTWFTDDAPEDAHRFWQKAYLALAGEAQNAAHAARAGFDVLSIRRLPAEAWWRGYYGPLERRIESLRASAAGDATLAAVLHDTEREIALFRAHGDAYGYAFYVLRAS